MRSLFAAVAVAGALCSPAASAGPEFKLVLLAPPPGGVSSGAHDINASGIVVGWFSTSDGRTAGFRWTPSTPAGDTGSAVPLGAFPGCNTSCNAEPLRINAHGHAVGYARGASGENRAVLWPASGTSPIDLGLPPGYTDAVAQDINDAGVVVGKSLALGMPTVAFRWTPSVPNGTTGTIEVLPGLSGALNSTAQAINNAGTVVGQSTLPLPSGGHAVRWASSTATDLEYGAGYVSSRATAVNTSGKIFGDITGLATSKLAFGFPDGPFGPGTAIGTLPGKTESEVSAVNGPGHVVGMAYQSGEGTELAYLWTSSKGIRDLNGLVSSPSSAKLRFARGINDDRRIVGEGVKSGISQAYLLIPGAAPVDSTRAVALEWRPYFEVCDPLRVCQVVRVTNVSARALTGPLQVVLNRIGGVQGLANAAGTYREAPFVTAALETLAPGAAVDVPLLFDRLPNGGGQPTYEIKVYAGAF